MVSYHIARLPRPSFRLERAHEVVIRALRFTSHHRANIARMTPESSDVSVVRWYNLLLHLVCVFYAIVACAVLGPYSLKASPCRQVPEVARVNDTVPRFRHPVLHCFIYPYAT